MKCTSAVCKKVKTRQDTLLLPITLPYVYQFSKFFHHKTQQQVNI